MVQFQLRIIIVVLQKFLQSTNICFSSKAVSNRKPRFMTCKNDWNSNPLQASNRPYLKTPFTPTTKIDKKKKSVLNMEWIFPRKTVNFKWNEYNPTKQAMTALYWNSTENWLIQWAYDCGLFIFTNHSRAERPKPGDNVSLGHFLAVIHQKKMNIARPIYLLNKIPAEVNKFNLQDRVLSIYERQGNLFLFDFCFTLPAVQSQLLFWLLVHFLPCQETKAEWYELRKLEKFSSALRWEQTQHSLKWGLRFVSTEFYLFTSSTLVSLFCTLWILNGTHRVFSMALRRSKWQL